MVAVLTIAIALPVLGADPSPEAARLDTFTHADGATNYFALGLRASLPEAVEPHDVVVLFDTVRKPGRPDSRGWLGCPQRDVGNAWRKNKSPAHGS